MVSVNKALGVILAATLWIACAPSATKEGQEWSHAELMDYLKSKGLQFDAKATSRGTFFGPAMEMKIDHDEVYVQVRKTAQEAKDEAATDGKRAFAWGRFYIASDRPAALEKVKAALP